MTWPNHQDPQPNRAAKAPYNFVPLPEKVLPSDSLPDQNAYHADRHTGWLDCVLTTFSPLYVRCGVLPSQFDQVEAKDLPEFFYTNPETLEPVIPGSSLRGMLRTLVEIVSYGKFQPVTDQKLVYRAVGDITSLGSEYRRPMTQMVARRTYASQAKAGYMHRRGQQWEIIPAKPLAGARFARIEQSTIQSIQDGLERWYNCKNAQKIYVDVGPVKDHLHSRDVKLRYSKVLRASSQQEDGLLEGVLVQTGWVSRKHMEFVFGLPEQGKGLVVPGELVAAYLDQITDGQKDLLGETAALRDWQPVFYVLDKGKLHFFGHAMMFRLPYPNTPHDLVPEALRDPSETDLAEAMFGYVEPDEKAKRPVTCAGRVFVSDATLSPGQGDVWLSDEPITPKILASPKPTTFQHYLVQTEPDDRSRLRHYASPTPAETVARGHKLYWHKGNVEQEDFEEEDPVDFNKDTQHTQIKPVRSGVRFRFRIHFEDLSDVELGALLWLLEMAADDDYRLKLGMGKPLGLGAVKVQNSLHLTDRTTRYTRLFEGEGWAIGEQSNADAVQSSTTQAFEHWGLNDRELNPRGATALKDIERIQMLRFLLSWPGPPREETRYLEIEHPEKGNEYKERPVLPTPAGVLIGKEPATPAPPPQPRPKRKPPALTEPQTVSHPTTVEEIKVGDLLEGQVIAVESNRAVIDIGVTTGSLGLRQLDRLVQQSEWFKQMYPGRALTARILFDEGTLEEDIGGTRVRIRVRNLEQRHGKTLIKLEFVEWLSGE